MSKERLEEMIEMSKIGELLSQKKKSDEKSSNPILWVLAILGAVAVVAAIAYGVYRYMTPDYFDDYDDDFDDDFEDDDFDDEDVKPAPEKKADEQ